MHVLEKRQGRQSTGLLIELPEYKIPSARTVAIYVKEKVLDYVQRAGTVIFVASVILWLLLTFGPQGYTEDMGQSFAAGDRPGLRAFLCSDRFGLLADFHGSHRGHFRERSRGLEHGYSLRA